MANIVNITILFFIKKILPLKIIKKKNEIIYKFFLAKIVYNVPML